jgi:hypothetical protein
LWGLWGFVGVGVDVDLDKRSTANRHIFFVHGADTSKYGRDLQDSS